MADIKAYTIAIPESTVQRLKQKLELTDLPKHEIEGAGWTYGTPLKDIERLTEYWKTKFDWREREIGLNHLPNFMTQITADGFDSLDIHFLHQKSQVKGAIPLLFVHGWPGSFLEVTKMLPFLKGGNGKPAFHVVAPSLPNYVFSSGVTKYAETCNKLMLALGYDQYGGDWGFLITRALGKLYPQHVKGSHVNWAFASEPEWTESNPKPEYSEREKSQLARGQDWWAGDGRGYTAIQSSKPSTIGFAFADSPIALLAWIYEKLAGWTDSYPWTDDEILTWISLYYFSTAGPEAPSYHYYEAVHASDMPVPVLQSYIDIPLGIADFPLEISNSPNSWWGTLGPVVYSKSFDKGGHFAGWERPEDIVEGLQEMFGKDGGAAGVVDGKSGY
ncbi:Epoxide Hydratase [Hyphodiscus hymeniophilus]|uniref:Epoxide Hydratase n=1 Tax=Hyphodiscus hymeniophilus TaxID=353542 RepID=A0A9P6VLJ2_9HELO|nr:Epoxide Hydratase [Hyphodiscus hymeniophilus]